MDEKSPVNKLRSPLLGMECRLLFLLMVLVTTMTVLVGLHVASAATLDRYDTGCDLPLRPGPLVDHESLFLHPTGSNDVFRYLDADASGHVKLTKGQEVLLACPGSKVGEFKEEVIAACDSGTDFTVNGKTTPLTALRCSDHPQHLDMRTGKKCGSGGRATHAVIGHNTSTGFISIMEVCFDESRLESLWSTATVRAHADGAEGGVDRPTFIGGNLFPSSLNPDYQYKRATQQKTFGKLLGSDELALKYIHNTSDYFLARGHFAAKADFVWAQPQRSTFYFSNAAPQWQTFNGGNWERLESSVRHEATKRSRDLLVITGVWGQLSLPDINGNEVPLSLLEDGRIPVPRVYWKVVYDNATRLGAAFVGMNNPYETMEDNPNVVLCRDVCSKIQWIDWDPTSVVAGEGYCCEVDDLRKSVPDMPELTVSGLMV